MISWVVGPDINLMITISFHCVHGSSTVGTSSVSHTSNTLLSGQIKDNFAIFKLAIGHLVLTLMAQKYW